MNQKKTSAMLFLILTLLAAGLAGCSSSADSGAVQGMPMAEMQHMPAEVKDAPTTVQQAYQFAVANPEVVKQFPCYCGCGGMGHTSNYSCYVQQDNGDGEITFDTHALGCSICVDITRDVMRLLNEQQSIPEIQTYIDATYGQYGPSNLSEGSG